MTDAGDGEGGFLGSAKEPRFRGKKEKCSRLMALSGGENYRVRNISMCTK